MEIAKQYVSVVAEHLIKAIPHKCHNSHYTIGSE